MQAVRLQLFRENIVALDLLEAAHAAHPDPCYAEQAAKIRGWLSHLGSREAYLAAQEEQYRGCAGARDQAAGEARPDPARPQDEEDGRAPWAQSRLRRAGARDRRIVKPAETDVPLRSGSQPSNRVQLLLYRCKVFIILRLTSRSRFQSSETPTTYQGRSSVAGIRPREERQKYGRRTGRRQRGRRGRGASTLSQSHRRTLRAAMCPVAVEDSRCRDVHSAGIQ